MMSSTITYSAVPRGIEAEAIVLYSDSRWTAKPRKGLCAAVQCRALRQIAKEMVNSLTLLFLLHKTVRKPYVFPLPLSY